MSATIFNSSFSLAPLNEKAYDFNIQFLDQNGHCVSNKKFTFIQQEAAQEVKIWDVFTKNGICSPSPLEHLFSKSDTQEIANVIKAIQFPKEGPIVSVLDLKHPVTGYLPQSEELITENENAVCAFFKSKTTSESVSKHTRKAHKLFQEKLPIDFVILEGSLKVNLLKKGAFTDEEITYFHTDLGVINFCQTAEFFMNAFKLGQGAYTSSSAFLAGDFIASVSSKFPSFQAGQVSTVFYPPLYQKIYSPEGDFAKVLQPVFSTAGRFNPTTKITTLSVEKKG